MKTLILVLFVTNFIFSVFPPLNKVQPVVFDFLKKKAESTDVLVLMKDEVDFANLKDSNGVHVSELDHTSKGRVVLEEVLKSSKQSQSSISNHLKLKKVKHRNFYVSNAIAVYGANSGDINELANRDDVLKVVSNEQVDIDLEEPDQIVDNAEKCPGEWNLKWVGVPLIWRKGFNGKGIVMAGSDTGVYYTHKALVSNYRGNKNGVFDHNYNWYDGSRKGFNSTVCPAASPAPCDLFGHGTHTMGTMVGGVDKSIGVVPGAKWIACRSIGTETNLGTFLACLQFFLAPHDLNGENPNPDLRPHVCGHSYGCRFGNVSCDWTAFERAVTTLNAAGVMTVASAGNSGPACNTITGPPGTLTQAFTVGASDYKTQEIAEYSSRGYVVEYPDRRKPDITAPGSKIWSSIPGDKYAEYSGTSMSCPLTAGSVGLLWSAFPKLNRDVEKTRKIFEKSAIAHSTKDCGIRGSPNNVYGYGNLNVWRAYLLAKWGV